MCAGISGQEPDLQVGMCSMLASGSRGGVMDSTLAQNGRAVGSVPVLGVLYPMFLTPPIRILKLQKMNIPTQVINYRKRIGVFIFNIYKS